MLESVQSTPVRSSWPIRIPEPGFLLMAQLRGSGLVGLGGIRLVFCICQYLTKLSILVVVHSVVYGR